MEFLAAVLCSFSPGGPLKVEYSIEKSTFMDFELYREKAIGYQLIEISIEAKRSETVWLPGPSPAPPSPAFSPLQGSCPSAKKGKRSGSVSGRK